MFERPMRRASFLILLVSLAGASCDPPAGTPRHPAQSTETSPLPPAGELAVPDEPGSIKFAVIGDSGRGSPEQYAVGRRMAEYRERFRFDFVLMLGDNIYEGPAGPRDYEARFEKPYEPMLREGVEFFAVLGNHDDPNQRNYPPFNMDGHRYYTFEKTGTGGLVERRRRARFFALDTTRLDSTQRAWLERELSTGEADWRILFFHHPLYSAGRYATWWRRRSLEPLLVRHGANVVFSGHDHLYVRLKPQRGVQHFVSGAAGEVRTGDFRPSAVAERGYDADLHFMLVEIAGDALYFQAISRTGQTVDAGVVRRHVESLE
jgi:predicted phosphodiesterase